MTLDNSIAPVLAISLLFYIFCLLIFVKMVVGGYRLHKRLHTGGSAPTATEKRFLTLSRFLAILVILYVITLIAVKVLS